MTYNDSTLKSNDGNFRNNNKTNRQKQKNTTTWNKNVNDSFGLLAEQTRNQSRGV